MGRSIVISRRNREVSLILLFLIVAARSDAAIRPLSSGGGPASGGRGDAFVTASISEPSNLIPFLASDSASAEISQLIFNGLVKYDENLKLTGDLAKNWEVSEEGLKIIFHLRRNVLWQDGAPFTAKDVLFTFEKLRDPKVPTPYGAGFEKVKVMRVLDDYTVEVEYSEPFSPGLASWSMGIIPEHLLSKENFISTPFSRHPVGTGPYKLNTWVSGERIVLSANEHYFEGRPNIERYVYRVIPDQGTTFLELQTENLDTAPVTPLQFEKQTQTPFFKKNYVPYHWSGMQYAYLGYNLRNQLFSDKRVRNAIGMAIDKREIIQAVFLGRGRVSTGPFFHESWASDLAVVPGVFDPKKSMKLLKEAGWTDTDGDSFLDKDGRRFSFTIMTNQGNDQRKMTCELIQKRLRDIGIELKIQTVEWNVFLKEFISSRRFDAVLLAWNLTPDPDLYPIFHSSQTGKGQFNFLSYQNREVDGLLEQGRKLFGEEKRAPLYRRIHQILAQEEPCTFLYEPESLTVLHRRFKGVTVTPLGLGYDFIRWFVPRDGQKYKIALTDA